MSTFQARLKETIGERGYENCMRRSVQSVILYEAHRCIAPQLPALRPFQRKLAFFDQANALLESIDFIHLHQKEEIMWRTATSKEKLLPDVAWKRMRLIDRELEKLVEKVKPYLALGRTHNQACDDVVQNMYEGVIRKEQKNNNQENEPIKPRPLHWEHAHNNVMLTFRMYYRGTDLDPSFPAPILPRNIIVPAEKPKAPLRQSHSISVPSSAANSSCADNVPSDDCNADDDDDDDDENIKSAGLIKKNGRKEREVPGGDADEELEEEENFAAKNGSSSRVIVREVIRSEKKTNPQEERRMLLSEVREHLEILKEFDGVISPEDINRRKQDLFLALPPAPPPSVGISMGSVTMESPGRGKKRQLGGGENGTSASSLPPAKKLNSQFNATI